MSGLIEHTLSNLSTSELRSAVSEDLAMLVRSLDGTRSETGPFGHTDRGQSTVSPDLAADLDAAAGLGQGDQNAIAQRLVPAAEAHAATIHAERLRQARLSFNTALVLSIAGVLIVLASLGLLLNELTTQGVVTVVAGTVCEVVAVLAFRLNKEANDRLDAVNRDLALLAKTRVIVDLVNGIADEKARSRAIAGAVRNLTAERPSNSG